MAESSSKEVRGPWDEHDLPSERVERPVNDP